MFVHCWSLLIVIHFSTDLNKGIEEPCCPENEILKCKNPAGHFFPDGVNVENSGMISDSFQ